MVDATLEEAKEAEGGYIKVSVKDIDSSAAINPQLKAKSRELKQNKEFFMHVEDNPHTRIAELEDKVTNIKLSQTNSKKSLAQLLSQHFKMKSVSCTRGYRNLTRAYSIIITHYPVLDVQVAMNDTMLLAYVSSDNNIRIVGLRSAESVKEEQILRFIQMIVDYCSLNKIFLEMKWERCEIN